MMIPLLTRASTRRWMQLGALLTSFERCLEASARLDGARRTAAGTTTGDAQLAWRFEHRLKTLERRIDREFDRLTTERLVQDLAAKRAQAAPGAVA